MIYILIKYFHIVSIFVFFSALVLEHFLLKRELSLIEVKKLAIVDAIYGASAIAVLLAGLLLWFAVGKASGFYSANPIFHIKVALFVLVGLLSIYPTVFFIKQRKSTATSISVPASMIMMVRLELLLLLLIPLFAVLMAQGYGLQR